MKTIINGLFLNGNFGGIHHTTAQLFNALHGLSAEVDLLVPQNEVWQGEHYRKIRPALPGRIGRILCENTHLSSIVNKGGYQVYHSMNYVLPLLSQKFRSVLTVHDTISLDLPRCCKNTSVLYHGLLMKRSVKQASKVIAVSQKVKEDIIRHFNTPEDKVEVIYHGIDPIFRQVPARKRLAQVRQQYDLPLPFLLFVGTIEPKKNLNRLLDAFLAVKKRRRLPHSLVIAGQYGWKSKSLLNRIDGLEKEGLIKKLDYVAQEDLPALYHLATGLAFPSLYEGFGLPPLEAMACSTPTLVSHQGALPEITGKKSILVDPYSSTDLEEGILELLTNATLRDRLIKEGLNHSQSFTWEKAAKQTTALYQNAS